jgi:hypothetical protein
MEMLGEGTLAETIAIMKQHVCKINIDPFRIIIQCEYSCGKRPSASFTAKPLNQTLGFCMVETPSDKPFRGIFFCLMMFRTIGIGTEGGMGRRCVNCFRFMVHGMKVLLMFGFRWIYLGVFYYASDKTPVLSSLYVAPSLKVIYNL